MKKQYYTYFVLSALLLIAQSKVTLAQLDKFCGATEATKKLYLAHPELVQDEINYNNAISQQVQAKKTMKAVETVRIIPIVFHILHTNGSENISDAQVFDQVAILNRDFGKQNADTNLIVDNTPFDTLAADTKIQFRLAQFDPDGNCTNGIDRIYSHKTNQADDFSKLNQWPREKYLNVWVIKTMSSVGTAGYAYYPSATNGFLFPYDGIIIIHSYIGSIGTASPFTSRALTHEVGHWLNLSHPWGNNNDPLLACGDDGVSDTPETKGHTSCDLYTPHCNLGSLLNLYNFADVTTGSGTTDPTTVPADSGVVFGSFNAMGVSTNPTGAGSFMYSMWDTGGTVLNNPLNENQDTLYTSLTAPINTGKYYEVTLTPWYGSSFSVASLNFTIARSGTGPRTFAVRSSLNGYTTNIAGTGIISPADTVVTMKAGNIFFIAKDTAGSLLGCKANISATTYYNQPVTFRIYAWNAEDTLGDFSIDNVSVTGNAGIIENTQNYMDYSYCSVMYTKEQKERMRAALESATSNRNNLWTTSNLIATGTNGNGVPCAPIADFYANRYSICTGSTVTFTKNIMNTIGTAATVSWVFENGTPATSTANSPVVTYSTPGLHKVSLTATNTAGVGTIEKDDYIRVVSGAEFFGLHQEPFEVESNYYYFWQSINPDAGSNGFGLSTSVGYNSSHSIIMGGYNNFENDVDELITPGYNLSGSTGVTLTFQCAAATRAISSTDMTDELKVYSSIDCGATWQSRKTFPAFPAAAGNPYLVNAGYHPEPFVPSGPSDWMLQSVTVPSSVITASSKTRFKFEYTSSWASNNFYIDDINLNGTVGINENSLDENNVSVYPNPSNLSSTVYYTLNKKADTKIQLVDVLGKKVMEITNTGQAEGNHQVNISKQELDLKNGIYFIKLTIDNNTIIKKLIITQ